jgi:hypothetical protein
MRKHAVLASLSAAVLAVTVGCSSSNNSGTPIPSPTPTPTATPTATPTPSPSVTPTPSPSVSPTPTPTATPTPTPTPPPELSFVSCVERTVDGNPVEDCTLSGTIDEDFTLDAGSAQRPRRWFLSGVVRVGTGNNQLTSQAAIDLAKSRGKTLTIPAGTIVRVLPGESTLVVTRGSTILANGTAEAPITFKASSTADNNFDGVGLWGGVIIQGFAPFFGGGDTGPCAANGQFCNIQGEGPNTVGFYGGNEPADNSGVFRYVRLAQGGVVTSANNEVNGLTLMGVGHGTQIEYIHVHNNRDDAVEWFGGTVNARYLVLTGNDDDEIDYDFGYQGNIQYVIAQRSQTRLDPIGGNDQRSIEAGTGGGAFTSDTRATIANMTSIAGPVVNDPQRMDEAPAAFALRTQPGILIRGATQADIVNMAILGYNNGGCVRIQDATTGNPPMTIRSEVALTNVLGDCNNRFYFNNETRNADPQVNSRTVSPLTLDAACALTNPEASLAAPATITATPNGSNFAFDQTDYVGAVRPGTPAAQAWWAGWTLPGTLSCGG